MRYKDEPCERCGFTELRVTEVACHSPETNRPYIAKLVSCANCGEERSGKTNDWFLQNLGQVLFFDPEFKNVRDIRFKRNEYVWFMEYEYPFALTCDCGPCHAFSFEKWEYVEIPADPTVRLYLNGARQGERVHVACGKVI